MSGTSWRYFRAFILYAPDCLNKHTQAGAQHSPLLFCVWGVAVFLQDLDKASLLPQNESGRAQTLQFVLEVGVTSGN